MEKEEFAEEERLQEMSENTAAETAAVSDVIREKPVFTAKSVYAGLVELAGRHRKLYGSSGRYSDTMKFDFSGRSAYVGNMYVVRGGSVEKTMLETSDEKIDVSCKVWLTDEERNMDPVQLYSEHWHSVPNGGERFRTGNFQACPADEMSDAEILSGTPRELARARLEAWILCAAVDGTLEKYVRAHGGDVSGRWYSMPAGNCAAGDMSLVIMSDWWRRPEEWHANGRLVVSGGRAVAEMADSATESETRAVESAERAVRLLRSLRGAALKLAVRGDSSLEHVMKEADAIVEYVERGNTGNTGNRAGK